MESDYSLEDLNKNLQNLGSPDALMKIITDYKATPVELDNFVKKTGDAITYALNTMQDLHERCEKLNVHMTSTTEDTFENAKADMIGALRVSLALCKNNGVQECMEDIMVKLNQVQDLDTQQVKNLFTGFKVVCQQLRIAYDQLSTWFGSIKTQLMIYASSANAEFDAWKHELMQKFGILDSEMKDTQTKLVALQENVMQNFVSMECSVDAPFINFLVLIAGGTIGLTQYFQSKYQEDAERAISSSMKGLWSSEKEKEKHELEAIAALMLAASASANTVALIAGTFGMIYEFRGTYATELSTKIASTMPSNLPFILKSKVQALVDESKEFIEFIDKFAKVLEAPLNSTHITDRKPRDPPVIVVPALGFDSRTL